MFRVSRVVSDTRLLCNMLHRLSLYAIVSEMLDWFSGIVGYDARSMEVGRLLRLSPTGEIEWECDTWEEAAGSYDDKLRLKPCETTVGMKEAAKAYGFLCSSMGLRLSGNPSKWLQGHNLSGPSVSCLGPVVQACVRRLPEQYRPIDWDSPSLPSVQRSRVDVAVMVDLGSHDVVHDWLGHAACETRSRHGRALQSGSTVYWGKHSTRWALKAYCKKCELVDHPASVPIGTEVLDWVSRMVRIELTLRRPELRDRGTLTEDLVWEFMRKIEVGVMKVNGVEQGALPRALMDRFHLWIAGHDVKTDVPKRTFYWQRRRILDVLGVDISLTPTEEVSKLESSSFDRSLFDIEVLKSRVSEAPPESLQCSLFDSPGDWPARPAGAARARRGRVAGRGD